MELPHFFVFSLGKLVAQPIVGIVLRELHDPVFAIEFEHLLAEVLVTLRVLLI